MMINLVATNSKSINLLDVCLVKKIVFELFKKVNPFNFRQDSFSFYQFPCRKFTEKLANIIKKDKNLNFEIVTEILFRSFPIRYITENIITNNDILKLAEAITPEIIGKNNMILERLLLAQNICSENIYINH